jgi:hypothetical protein
VKVSKEDEDDSKTKEEMKNESDQSDDNSDGDGNSGSFAAGEDAEVRDVIYKLELLALSDKGFLGKSLIPKYQLAV